MKNLISKELLYSLLQSAKNDNVQKYVVGAVIQHDDKFLVLRRCPDEFMAGLIELPSGNVDAGEDLIEALIREVKEETNLDVVLISTFISTFDYTSGSGKRARQFNFLIETADTKNIQLNPLEHDWFKWIDNSEESLSKHNISNHTKSVLRKATK